MYSHQFSVGGSKSECQKTVEWIGITARIPNPCHNVEVNWGIETPGVRQVLSVRDLG